MEDTCTFYFNSLDVATKYVLQFGEPLYLRDIVHECIPVDCEVVMKYLHYKQSTLSCDLAYLPQDHSSFIITRFFFL